LFLVGRLRKEGEKAEGERKGVGRRRRKGERKGILSEFNG
jgi:hypothetical protein